ncbi:LysR family transcriptional regulator [Cupriavidus consociatus]|uniref:LysR family transcriptional regulator n=1 Tax=Cupriavidus consociatus TaxID=2821357 RepID=UPI001AE6A3D2|nr:MULTISPECIES: LysR family transcriptional regulator [unclassified Cupriavidus]MBP0625082.1 LysR family transcriptional regulator [Cupriavidus sp. LEh25]MDK2661818.1 LysR family transcriptional regulator [Cupriavidus sp. LEh21]
MELRQLRYFIAVAEHASITLAAESIHIAQPALTRQMQTLEQDLGATLMERSARGIRLTEAGKQLLVDARKILEEEAAAKLRVQRASRGEVGHLSIGLPVMQSLPPRIAGILRAYHRAVPGVALTLHHLLSDAQLELLRSGRLDAGFLLFRPVDDPTLAGMPVFSDAMLLAYPSDWNWAAGRPKVLRDLQDVEFVWLPRSAAPTWHDQLIHCFFDAGFTPRAVVHGVDAGSMLSLVAAGMGCTILPESARDRAPSTVSFLSLDDLRIRQDWEFVWRTDRPSALIERFRETVTQACGDQLASS